MEHVGRKVHAKKQARIKEKVEVKEKRRLLEPKFFRICPKCGSAKVGVSKTRAHPDLPLQYACGKCKYSSYFFPATTKERVSAQRLCRKFGT